MILRTLGCVVRSHGSVCSSLLDEVRYFFGIRLKWFFNISLALPLLGYLIRIERMKIAQEKKEKSTLIFNFITLGEKEKWQMHERGESSKILIF